MPDSVAIIGSGIVGICTAIELLKTGHSVTLFDTCEPGTQTSRWNAGVLTPSSLVPLNNPRLFGKLPKLLTGRVPGFRINSASIARTLPWGARFLMNARTSRFNKTVRALHDLITLSREAHQTHLAAIGKGELLACGGWIVFYRNEADFRANAFQLRIYDRFGIDYHVLSPEELATLEPCLRENCHRAVHVRATASAEPALILRSYVDYARQLGAVFLKGKVTSLAQTDAGVAVSVEGTEREVFDRAVISAGAWSNDVLESLKLRLPMAVERGYLQTFELQGGARLTRPIYDTANGCVVSPRVEGIQISTGTELTELGAPADPSQIEEAISRMKRLLPLGAATMDTPAVGNRPTLVDSLPAIGALRNHPDIWLACGHQHIGFSTSAGTGRLIAAQMNQTALPIEASRFSPARFGI